MSIKIKTIGAEGSPISGAVVTLDGEKIGVTNAFGTFNTSKDLSTKQRHKLTITKSDEQYYFAPYLESIKMKPGIVTQAHVTATMYVIPKPKYKATLTQNAESPQNIAHAAIENDSLKQNDANPSQASANHDEIGNHATSLPLLQFTDQEAATTSATQQATNLQKEGFFTVHVYSGRAPIHKALVKWHSGKGEINSCETNERGRCMISTTEELPSNGSLLIQHEGHISQIENMTATHRSNIRSALKSGRSIDIFARHSGPFSQIPLAEVDVRYDGITVAQTNSFGLAVFPLKSDLPIILTLEHPSRQSTMKVTVNHYNNAKITANFSNHSATSWNKWSLYKTHVNKEFKEEITQINRTICEDYISKATHSNMIESSPVEFSKLANDEIALLPIVSSENGKIFYTLQAYARSGFVASSNVIEIRSPALQESWKIAADHALNSLNGHLPWAGTVSEVRDDKLMIAINTANLTTTDTLKIETSEGLETLSILSINKNIAVAKLTSRLLKLAQVEIIGSHVAKSVSNAIPSKLRLEQLRIAFKLDKNLTMAKKYFAENNPVEAQKWLDQVSESGGKKLIALQMQAILAHSTGNIAEALSFQRDIAKFALASKNHVAELVAKTNIARLQTEMIPTIAKQEDVAARLTELNQECESLTVSTPPTSPNNTSSSFTESSSAIRAHLEYTKLLAVRKRAEVEEDLVSLATLSGLWETAEKAFFTQELANRDGDTWRKIITFEKSRITNSMSGKDMPARPM